jgi:hypothetical protein
MNDLFGPDSLTGFELELICPRQQTRQTLAAALAKELGGDVVVGLKQHAFALDAPGPRSAGAASAAAEASDLALAFRTRDFEIVDDLTLQDGLDDNAPTPTGLYRVVIDDHRLATLCERVCEAATTNADDVLRNYLDIFRARLASPGASGAADPTHRVARDPRGRAIAVTAAYAGDRMRAAEIVLRPLKRDERAAMLTRVLAVVRDFGCTIPREAALHVHVDAQPWQSTARLRRLILDADAARDILHREWKPPAGAKRLGRTDADVLALVEKTPLDTPFPIFAEALLLAGTKKFVDINVLGALPWARQPTIEVRCLPMSLDPAPILALVDEVEDFLRGIASSADRV